MSRSQNIFITVNKKINIYTKNQIELSFSSMDQQYCLKWSNHLSNLSNVFFSLLEREALCDVILSVGVDQKIKVRSLITENCVEIDKIFLPSGTPNDIISM